MPRILALKLLNNYVWLSSFRNFGRLSEYFTGLTEWYGSSDQGISHTSRSFKVKSVVRIRQGVVWHSISNFRAPVNYRQSLPFCCSKRPDYELRSRCTCRGAIVSTPMAPASLAAFNMNGWQSITDWVKSGWRCSIGPCICFNEYWKGYSDDGQTTDASQKIYNN